MNLSSKPEKLLFLAASLVLTLLPACQALPIFLVEAGMSKCIFVEAPVRTVLRIDYRAFGKLVGTSMFSHSGI